MIFLLTINVSGLNCESHFDVATALKSKETKSSKASILAQGNDDILVVFNESGSIQAFLHSYYINACLLSRVICPE